MSGTPYNPLGGRGITYKNSSSTINSISGPIFTKQTSTTVTNVNRVLVKDAASSVIQVYPKVDVWRVGTFLGSPAHAPVHSDSDGTDRARFRAQFFNENGSIQKLPKTFKGAISFARGNGYTTVPISNTLSNQATVFTHDAFQIIKQKQVDGSGSSGRGSFHGVGLIYDIGAYNTGTAVVVDQGQTTAQTGRVSISAAYSIADGLLGFRMYGTSSSCLVPGAAVPTTPTGVSSALQNLIIGNTTYPNTRKWFFNGTQTQDITTFEVAWGNGGGGNQDIYWYWYATTENAASIADLRMIVEYGVTP